MRLLRIGCGILFLLALTCLGFGYSKLVGRPQELHQETIAKALADSVERHKDWPTKLKDPKINGFLQPDLRLYWSAMASTEDAAYKKADSAVSGWADRFTKQGSGREIDHQALLRVKSVEYLAARSAFVELLPALLAAFEKPMFQPPNDDFTRPELGIQFDNLRRIAIGLDGYAESLVAEGDLERATLAYQLVFRMGKLISEDAGMVQTFAGVSIQGLGFQSFVSQISDSDRLSFSAWRNMSLALAQSAITSEQLERALENDTARGVSFLALPRSSFDGDARYLRSVYLLPGVQARDERIYKNLMGASLEAVRESGYALRAPEPSLENVAEGSTSWVVNSLLLPVDGYRTESARLLLHSAKFGGLAAYTGICAYHALIGKWPDRLSDLDKIQISAPGGVLWSKLNGINYYTDGKRPEIEVLLPAAAFEEAQVSLASSSIAEGMDSKYFRLGPKQYWFSVAASTEKAATEKP